MIAEGCIMLRACHRDTCKPGVATQRPHLRANFTGTPEGVAAYFLFVAEEVRRHLAAHRRPIARRARSAGSTCCAQRTTGDARADSFDLAFLLEPPERRRRAPPLRRAGRPPGPPLGARRPAAGRRLPRRSGTASEVELAYPITNADRSVGTALVGRDRPRVRRRAAPRLGHASRFDGTAGQSFGAFLAARHRARARRRGQRLRGQGHGRRPHRHPPAGRRRHPRSPVRPAGSSTVLAGNTCLYGATGGELFVAGAVGERFAVRNSGAVAVVEAVGDHCCEYMTGGTVVVLGRIGYNLGAGMTGGQAFVWDPEVERVLTRVNADLVGRAAARPRRPRPSCAGWSSATPS